MKLNYRLIVSDFDGTLITSDGRVLPEVKSAIDEYIANGGIFAVCTGRMLCCILPRVRELGLKGIVVAYQGTVIADIESGKLLKNGGLNYNDASEICEYLEELGQPVNVYCGDTMYTTISKDNVYLQKYESIVGIDAVSINGKISEFVRESKLRYQKVSVLIHKNERNGLYFKLVKKFADRFDITCSAKELVEVSPLTDNKGEALRFLANHYNVPMDKTIAVGDNLNDLSMIKAAGLGVAVENAEQELKEVAGYISVSNNDGAVAQIIKKFGFA